MSIALSLIAVACSSAPSGPDASSDAASDALPESAPDAAKNCSAAREQLLSPINSVSSGDVSILSDTGGVKTLYVDASAGGSMVAATNPRVYVDLANGTKVNVTDGSATTSTAWDLAIKRPILFTNGGDAGPGQGGSIFLPGKDFANVTAADANGKTFALEHFVDADCSPLVDRTGALLTTFDGWYDYDQSTNKLSPHPGTWIVRGGTGKLFKLQILGYYATPDGGMSMSGGRYTLSVAQL